MIPFIIAGAALFTAGVVLTKFWKEIKSFLLKGFEMIKSVVIPSLIEGFEVYLRTGKITQGISATITGLQKFYSRSVKNARQWEEHIITRSISYDQIPSHIRARLENARDNMEINITAETSQELKLEM